METTEGQEHSRRVDEGAVLQLRLYIAGHAPNSTRAVANLEALCRNLPADCYHIEIIDTLKDPLRALNDGILVTPTLRKVSPLPTEEFIGDLSDQRRVRQMLGIEEASHG